MTSNLAKIEPQQAQLTEADPYSPGTFNDAWKLAQIVVKSRLAPSIQTPEAAFVVLATGNELGLSPMQALRGIVAVKGKPTLYADTMVAVALQKPQCEYFKEVETTDSQSTWETKRVGSEPRRYTFTMADAKTAGLTGNDNYKKYPRRMLAARCKAFLARDVYPDLLLGLYTPEEMTAGKAPPSAIEYDDSQTTTVHVVEQRTCEAHAEDDPPPDSGPTDHVADFTARIQAAQTRDDLRSVAAVIKQAPLDSEQKAALAEAYKQRQGELSNAS